MASINFVNNSATLDPLDFTLQKVWFWVTDHTIVVIQFIKIFLVQFFVYSFHLFLIPLASTRSLPFLSFLVLIFEWNVPLIFPIFLKRPLASRLLSFSLVLRTAHWTRPSCLSVLFFENLHLVDIPFPLSLAFCISSILQQFVKPPQMTALPSSFSFSFGVISFTASCTVLQTCIHTSSGTLFTRYNPLNLFVTSLRIHRGFDLSHTWLA